MSKKGSIDVAIGRTGEGATRVIYHKNVGKSYDPSSKYQPHQGKKEAARAAKRAAKKVETGR